MGIYVNGNNVGLVNEAPDPKFKNLIDGSLTEITAEDLNGLSSIRQGAFYYLSLTSITIPTSVTSIGAYAFYYCSRLERVTFDGTSQCTSIGDSAFRGSSSLTSITIPSSVTSISQSAFYNCSSLTSITIPSSVTSLGSEVFYNCTDLETVTFEEPSPLTTLNSSTFRGCSNLTNITLPNGIRSIGFFCFMNCSSLISITIPSSVTSIYSSVFDGCSSLTTMIIKATNPPTLSSTLPDTLQTIYIPAGTLGAYQSANNWSRYANKFVEMEV